MKECIIRLSLDGKHTFNPVYIENVLQGSRFVDVASIIRAAAKNFSGKSNDAPIWEESAFNLTKNIVVYCGAAYKYYTLNDIYSEILKASIDGLSESLSAILKEGEFNDEEYYNIECAIKYFIEFSAMEEKFRSGVSVTATTFLSQFQEYQISRIFCPDKSNLTLPSMDRVIDEQMILLVDIDNAALSKAMGTFVKLHYEKSVLGRLKDPSRTKKHMAIIVADEYQDLASVSNGSQLGDETVLAKGREANFFFLAASQSVVSLLSSIGNEKAAKELIQNFRTRIACHSSDLETIRNFKELMGQKENERVTSSISESSQKASRNYLLGGFDSRNANISESVSTSQQKEYIVTGKEFSELQTFESFAQIYDGVRTTYNKLYLKPYFLKRKNRTQKQIVKLIDSESQASRPITSAGKLIWRYLRRIAYMSLLVVNCKAMSFPNVCDVVAKPEFNSCLNYKVTPTTCGWPPRPCARLTYNVPQTFIEVSPKVGSSYFSDLPGTAFQLVGLKGLPPIGVEGDDDTHSYHAHTIAVPFADVPFKMMPCGGTRTTKFCFDGMSEHILEQWSTGSGDKFQPNFLAWALAPKVCLLKGAAMSAIGGEKNISNGSNMCSVPLPPLTPFKPSSHSACNGWGVFYPRVGTYNGPSSMTAALMIASRIKSVSSDVFASTPVSLVEQWQMISPGSSSCFSEGQNLGILETIKNAREIGRLTSGKLTGHLFVVWKQVSCTRDLHTVPVTKAAIAAMPSACVGLGGG